MCKQTFMKKGRLSDSLKTFQYFIEHDSNDHCLLSTCQVPITTHITLDTVYTFHTSISQCIGQVKIGVEVMWYHSGATEITFARLKIIPLFL